MGATWLGGVVLKMCRVVEEVTGMPLVRNVEPADSPGRLPVLPPAVLTAAAGREAAAGPGDVKSIVRIESPDLQHTGYIRQ